jgi:hypothetical protein
MGGGDRYVGLEQHLQNQLLELVEVHGRLSEISIRQMSRILEVRAMAIATT